ncbi:UDP binding domain-containing protein [Sphingomonas sp. PP-CC-3A-396]|uniref:UDP binding domain-containing protein n=1 Tax=Sphingomonas sp. PP-CC-3A-396 TaxID=2135655 RepID=UPI0010D9CB35|nr:UDP binding domain-containing protein [Sphingomonas sp. PP-CC-3A-396]TCQ02866.1 UDP-glucose/GDP-mannose dehydrogenase family protein [Sphingomonas sp. PP-CC-3A-396]
MNDGMAKWVAKDVHDWHKTGAGRILVLGLAFKQDVPDLRNSKIADLIAAFRNLGHQVDVHDPIVSPAEALREHGLEMILAPSDTYDLIVLAVPHRELLREFGRFAKLLATGGSIVDLKNALATSGQTPAGVKLWTM